MSELKKPEITEHSCIKAMELMVKWEAYFKQEMDKIIKKQKSLCLELCNSEIRLSNYKVSSEAKLKDKCSVEKLEGIIDVNTFKGGISMVQDYILVPKKDLATALNRYIIEDKQ